MRVLTNSVVAAAFAALSTTANAWSESTFTLAPDSYNADIEQVRPATLDSGSTTDSLSNGNATPSIEDVSISTEESTTDPLSDPSLTSEDELSSNADTSKIDKNASESTIDLGTESPSPESSDPSLTSEDELISNAYTSKIDENASESTIDLGTESPSPESSDPSLTSEDELSSNADTSKIDENASESTIDLGTESPSPESSDPSLTSEDELISNAYTSKIDENASESTIDPGTESTLDSSVENSSSNLATDQSMSGGRFTDDQRSIWIERHNFFRREGLPWAAGDMKRMGWDDSLAKDAAVAAASCAANTSTGINVYESTSTDASVVIEEAINAWIIKPSLQNIGLVVPPAVEGDSVGAGMYNAYTQVVWASTTGVGCDMASCSGGSMVVCKYSPAGNDGKSAWYTHYAQATHCPTGTTAVQGLCVVEGDPANDLIAPIPDGKLSIQVYPTFVADIMAAILEASKTRNAGGSDTSIVIDPTESEKPTGLDAEQTIIVDPETSLDSMDASNIETSLSSNGDGEDGDDIDCLTTATPDETSFSDIDDTSSPLSLDVKNPDDTMDSFTETTDSSSPYSGNVITAPKSLLNGFDSLSSEVSDPATELETLSSTSSSGETQGNLRTSPISSYEEDSLAKVTPGSPTESDMEDQKLSPMSESTTTSLESTPSTDSAKPDNPDTPDSSKQTPATKANVLTVQQLSTGDNIQSSMSATSVAGCVLASIVVVVALAVYVGYRKNQQRQRDIMRDGGIEVI